MQAARCSTLCWRVRSARAAGIPSTEVVEPAHAERLWRERKQLFFKPFAGFGGRAAYRGDKLTQRVWQDILAGGYIAQALVTPGGRVVSNREPAQVLKFDLRDYVYGGSVQWVAARMYQGQTTNFRTPVAALHRSTKDRPTGWMDGWQKTAYDEAAWPAPSVRRCADRRTTCAHHAVGSTRVMPYSKSSGGKALTMKRWLLHRTYLFEHAKTATMSADTAIHCNKGARPIPKTGGIVSA